MNAQMRLAVFDVDGTLVDSQHNILAAMTAAWRLHGLGDPEPAAVRRIIGLSLVEAVATLLPAHEPDLHETLAQSYKDAFFTLRISPTITSRCFPGRSTPWRRWTRPAGCSAWPPARPGAAGRHDRAAWAGEPFCHHPNR